MIVTERSSDQDTSAHTVETAGERVPHLVIEIREKVFQVSMVVKTNRQHMNTINSIV